MDYLKVPEYPQGWINDLGINPFHSDELKNYNSTLSDSEWRWLADLINAVYTPTTGLLAQIEAKEREIEELSGKVKSMCSNQRVDGFTVCQDLWKSARSNYLNWRGEYDLPSPVC